MKKFERTEIARVYSPLQGSSQNFHYLVLQRCVTSLLDALDPGADSTAAAPPLSRFSLSSIQCVHQLLNAIAFLHSKSIGRL